MRKNVLQNKLGMTLIEALMAVAIFAMGIGGFTLLFSKTWQSNAYVLEMGQSSMAVSQGLNKMVDYIRRARQGDDGSYPVKSVGANDLVIFCDYNKDGITERLHFYKTGQDVLMGVTSPTSTMPKTYPSGDQQIINIATRIVNNSSTPIFYYYNKDYPGDVTNNPLAGTIDVSTVRLVKAYMEININPNHAPDNVKIQTFVEMRNLNDYDHLK